MNPGSLSSSDTPLMPTAEDAVPTDVLIHAISSAGSVATDPPAGRKTACRTSRGLSHTFRRPRAC